MEEVQSIASRRCAGCSPRMDALDLPRHIDVVPVRSQTLACGGDVPRATWCLLCCLLVSVRPEGAAGVALAVLLLLALDIYSQQPKRDTTLTRVTRDVT